MTAQNSQSVAQAGTTPTPLTPQTTDTISEANFGPYGLYARLITTGTTSNFTVTDPGATALGNAGTAVAVALPATGVRMVFIPRGAIAPATGLATITFSSVTGVTYELYRA